MPILPTDPKFKPKSKLDPRGHPDLCGHWGGRRTDGGLCCNRVIGGTHRCRLHSGKTRAKAKAEGAVRLELARWGLDGHTDLVDPGEVLLRLVTQSAVRCELYGRLLGEAFQAAESLREAAEVPDADGSTVEVDEDGMSVESPAVQAARANLRRVFVTGGVAALVGVKLDADRFGRVFATEEAVRGLARLEAEERDRCANFAAKAVAAGLADRLVRLADRQGQQMFTVIMAVVGGLGEALGLTVEQRELVPSVVPGLLEREVRALTAGPTP